MTAFVGWVSHAVVKDHTNSDFVEVLNNFPVTKIPDLLKDFPPSLFLGIFGMTGYLVLYTFFIT